ncbi:MAG: hypothetical protein H7A03_00465 [Pseudomonadales bacterium]|nr:hypothetical protein [Pseudomonadales bacterium]
MNPEITVKQTKGAAEYVGYETIVKAANELYLFKTTQLFTRVTRDSRPRQSQAAAHTPIQRTTPKLLLAKQDIPLLPNADYYRKRMLSKTQQR